MKRDSANIIRSFIAHKRLIYIIVLAFIAVGVIGLFFINKDEFPSFQIKQGLVAGVFPGATASEVEDRHPAGLIGANYSSLIRRSSSL